jgi:hypothetical protein
VFDGFDPEKVARYDKKKVRELLRDAGIIRNRLKIDATIGYARAFLAVQKEFGSFDALHLEICWRATETKWLESSQTRSCKDARIRRPQQRPPETRFPVRRLNHLLRPHAGHRTGQTITLWIVSGTLPGLQSK